MGRRLDPADTLEGAIHLLHGLAEAGWAVERVEHTVAYAKVQGRRLPVEAKLVVRLIPAP